MKSHESSNQNLKLITIDYKKPNYEKVKHDLNWNEPIVKARVKSRDDEPRHLGMRICHSQERFEKKGIRYCLNEFEGWIYDDPEMDSIFQGMCPTCSIAWHSEPINKPIVKSEQSSKSDWYQKSKPIKIISWGGGKDSSILVLKYGYDADEIILSDTGAEEVETYEYIKYFMEQLPREIRDKITIIQNDHLGKIDDWHFEKKMIPMPFANRQCTDKFKLRPIHKYIRKVYGKDAVFDMMVGINYDEQIERERPLPNDDQLDSFLYAERNCNYTEDDLKKLAHRQNISVEDYKERVRNQLQTGGYMKDGKLVGGCQYARNVYPLCDEKIGTEKELEIFSELGLIVPPKSGCYFCPMKGKKAWNELEQNHPDLYENTKRLDTNSTSKINILKMSEEKESEMRCSCSNGLFDAEAEPEEPKDFVARKSGRGF